MARIRYIKPEFFDDAQVAKLTFGARLLFIGMWTIMDRSGLLEATPLMLRSKLYPYDDVSLKQVEGWVNELIQSGRVLNLCLSGQVFLYCPTFKRHQKFHPREHSKYSFTEAEYTAATQQVARQGLGAAEPPPSRVGRVTGTGMGTSAGGQAPAPGENDFRTLYQKYPRKKGGTEGIQRLIKTIHSWEEFNLLSLSIDNYRREILRDKTEMKHIRHFSTFVGPVDAPSWRDYLEADSPVAPTEPDFDFPLSHEQEAG